MNTVGLHDLFGRPAAMLAEISAAVQSTKLFGGLDSSAPASADPEDTLGTGGGSGK